MIYNQSFIDFVHDIFPSINPYTSEQVKNSIDQFYRTGADVKYFTEKRLGFLSQGDIISHVRFLRTDENGVIGKLDTMGMVISNTCDIENDDSIVVAPLVQIDQLDLSESDLSNLKRNRIYRFIFIPENIFTDFVVDLSRVTTFNKAYIEKSIDENRAEYVASLNQLGYYFFLCKIAIHFLRPEDTTVQNKRFEMQ